MQLSVYVYACMWVRVFVCAYVLMCVYTCMSVHVHAFALMLPDKVEVLVYIKIWDGSYGELV